MSPAFQHVFFFFFLEHNLFHISTYRLLPGDWGACLGQLSRGLRPRPGPSKEPAIWGVAVLGRWSQNGGWTVQGTASASQGREEPKM